MKKIISFFTFTFLISFAQAQDVRVRSCMKDFSVTAERIAEEELSKNYPKARLGHKDKIVILEALTNPPENGLNVDTTHYLFCYRSSGSNPIDITVEVVTEFNTCKVLNIEKSLDASTACDF